MRSAPQPERLGRFVLAAQIIRTAKARGVLEEVLALSASQQAALNRAREMAAHGRPWAEVAKRLNEEAPRKDGGTWTAKRLRALLGSPPRKRELQTLHGYSYDVLWNHARHWTPGMEAYREIQTAPDRRGPSGCPYSDVDEMHQFPMTFAMDPARLTPWAWAKVRQCVQRHQLSDAYLGQFLAPEHIRWIRGAAGGTP